MRIIIFLLYFYPTFAYHLTHIITTSDIFIRKTPDIFIRKTPETPYGETFKASQNESIAINFKTIKYLSEMSYDAYIKINDSDWYNFNASELKSSVKGYVFWHDNRYIISLKGTSLFIETAKDDRFNDNLFFSCCYYKQSSLFTGNYSCSINTPEHTCSKNCYLDSKNFDRNYLNALDKIGSNLESVIDMNNVIFTGHSLGGLMATYLAIKYNKAAVTFETPGTRHYFDAILLDYKHVNDKIFHFGHTADPIFMGKCDLRSSLCYIGGYILRTKCHVGNTCIYDSKNKLNISESILKHRMGYMIKTIIPHWENDFPECKRDTYSSCSDCDKWSNI